MGLLFNTIPPFIEVLFGLLLTFFVFYRSVTKRFKYWEDRGVPHPKPTFLFGNTKELVLGRKYVGQVYADFYEEFPEEPFVGIYDMSKPVVVVRDPELVKHILTRDFEHFQDRLNIDGIVNPKVDYLAKHLFHLRGKEWKSMRFKLSSSFTVGKIKMMFILLERCGKQLTDHMEERTKQDAVIDIKDVLARFTLDSIATCAFGLETNCLKNRDCKFYHYALEIFQFTIYRHIKRILFSLFPKVKKITGARLWPRDMTDFYSDIVRETLEYRKRNQVSRNDFLNLLIQFGQNKHYEEQRKQNWDGSKPLRSTAGLTIEEITAQTFLFLAAGYETASSTMSFCLYELAQNPDIQDRLYEEVKAILKKHEGKPTYQALQEMPYMDKVIYETLRRYASLPVLHRVCSETYKVPGSDLVIEKGISVVIPTFALHHDPQFYPEPLKFDPERFSPERVRERHPYVHLPFGEGPRMCIGMKFGLVQTKLGLTHMLLNYKFGLSPQTQIPATFNKTSYGTMPEKPILLRVTKR